MSVRGTSRDMPVIEEAPANGARDGLKG